MDTWDIGLAPHVIYDGVYPNLQRGQIARFAVEFWPYALDSSAEAVIHAERVTEGGHKSNNAYHVNAKVEYAAEWDEVFYAPAPGMMDGLPKWDAQGEPIFYHFPLVRQTRPEPVCVLDCGIRTYREGGKNLPTNSGGFVNATIGMSIDQFFRSDFPPTARDMPPIIYTWHIEEITLFTAPLVEKRDEVGRLRREYDMEQIISQSIEQMDAHRDDHGWYTLRCTKLDFPPVHMNRREMQAYYAQDKMGKRYQ